MAIITAAANARAGRTLRGRPRSSATRYTLPMTADLAAEGDNPDISAYSHIAISGNTR